MDYSKAKIYKIFNTVDDTFYIGATCQPLSKRMVEHRCNATRPKKQHYKIYQKMNVLGIENFYIELVREYPECENIEQLRKREGEYIREMKPELNHVISGRTHDEWIKQHKEHKNQLDKEYYHKYKDEKRDERKQYYQEKRDGILKEGRTKVECPICQNIYSKSFLNKHIKKQHS